MPRESVDLICDMVKNSSSKNGRRWNHDTIKFALELYSRSPRVYTDICLSGYLVLPSERLLCLYKNVVTQVPGINHDNLEWMANTAKQNNLPEFGYNGGIVLDEMAIQEDLQLDSNEGTPSLVGTVDYGPQGNNLDTLRTGEKDIKLATHALQFEFLGATGFVFPFAHWPTKGVQAYHLLGIFWEVVQALLDFGFHTDFCLFDGAVANRVFLKSLFTENPLKANMKTPNLIEPGRYIIFGMDVKHVVKRLRNSVLSSGNGSSKKLQWQGSYILWEHWQQAFDWDLAENPETMRIHHKLTKQHLDPTNPEKMRNHLAEECLDADMLNLMETYSNHLPDGEFLRGTIAFLQQTSKLVHFMNTEQYLYENSDPRIDGLSDVARWFLTWEKEITDDPELTADEKRNKLMPWETMEDIQFCITSLIEICMDRLNNGHPVLPSRINSDVVENFFCQQRATSHGSNDNPSYLQYSKAVNSIILKGGNKRSSKKSNAGLKAAVPLSMTTDRPLVKRARKQ